MKEKIAKFFELDWLLGGSRVAYFCVLLLIGFFLGIEAVFAASASAQFKNWLWRGAQGGAFGWIRGNGFNWLCFLSSMIGGSLGCFIKFFFC